MGASGSLVTRCDTFCGVGIKVVTSNNTAIFRGLKSAAFRAVKAEQLTVTTGPEALRVVQTHKPDLVVLDVDLPEQTGYEVCKQIKGDPALGNVRVILVITGSPNRDDVDRLADSGCDDIMTIPTPAEDLYSHAARLLNLPTPKRSRVLAQIVMPAGSRTPVLRGEAVDIGLDAVTVTVEHRVDVGTEIKLRLGRAGAGPGIVVRGTIIACDDTPNELSKSVRVRLVGLRAEDEQALADLALWEVMERDDGLLVIVRGDITENTDFAPLLAQVKDAANLAFDMGGVRYLNSTGMMRWCKFLEELSADAVYTFVRASGAFIMQLGLVPQARGRGKVVSFMAPYYCEMCDAEREQILQASSLELGEDRVPVAPSFDCPKCHGALILDELPERFFAFVAAQP